MKIIRIVLGLLAALFVGFWLALVGGLVQIIEAAKLTPVDSYGVAIGLIRMALAVPAGWALFFVISIKKRLG